MFLLKRPLLSALLLGFGTSALIGLLKALPPFSEAKDQFIESLAMPGALLIGLVYPQGVHSEGAWVMLWPLWVLLLNLAIYILVWYLCLLVLRLFLGGGQGTPARS